MPIHFKSPDLTELKPKIAVIGVGGAGGNAVNNMIAAKLQGVNFVVANTDAQALIHSQADTKIQLGVAMTEGLGAGSKPEIGAAAAEESIEEIRTHLRGLHMVFITAGMGGGTGTGAAPVIAAAARQEGVLTVGVVTKPFHFEGQRRMRSAEFGIELLSEQVDTLIVIPNQNLFRVAVMKTTFSEAFAMADQVLHDGISCITDVMVKEGIINLDFADVNLVMRGSGKAMMGTGMAQGENRGREAAEAAITNPLLDDLSLQGARGLLVSIIGGSNDLTLYEVDEAANRVREEVAPDANIFIGTAFDESLNGTIRVSVVATGLDENAEKNDTIEKRPMSGHSAASLANQSLAGKPDTGDRNKEPSLASRLDELQAGSYVRPSGQENPAQQVAVSDEQGPRFSHADPAQAAMETERGKEFGDMPGIEMTGSGVKMPDIEDFPPVGQALLRDQGLPGETRPMAAGIEMHKQRVGFFERLASFAGGRRREAARRENVANEPQTMSHSVSSGARAGEVFLDPHKKGGALSNARTDSHIQMAEIEELSEFPAFLRK